MNSQLWWIFCVICIAAMLVAAIGMAIAGPPRPIPPPVPPPMPRWMELRAKRRALVVNDAFEEEAASKPTMPPVTWRLVFEPLRKSLRPTLIALVAVLVLFVLYVLVWPWNS